MPIATSDKTVQTVTGNVVDNADAAHPIVTALWKFLELFRGDFNPAATYAPGDVVRLTGEGGNGGRFFAAIVDQTGTSVGDPSAWQPLDGLNEMLGTAAFSAITDYATAEQGTTADNALQPSGDGSNLTGITAAQVGADAAGTAAAAIAALLADPTTLATLMTAAGITPVVDGTVSPVTSETTVSGIVTALS